MIYSELKNDRLSLLGLGAMRLPTLENGRIDEERTREMVDHAIKNGINYFDTAYPYHNGESETMMGKILKDYPRESFCLATKYPGHQIAEKYDPAEIFEHQLRKCDVEYFDYYLLHNINENSIKTYMDPQWKILDYFREQKRLGRIRHLGFSFHGGMDNLREFLDYCGDDTEFAQIQLNYLDWTLQSAKEKYELLTERGIPVWIMEPVRGGKLVNLPKDAVEKLKSLRPDESVAAWCFRFIQGLPNVKMVLSGMSNMEQLTDNIKTFSERKSLTDTELDAVFEIAEALKNAVPCTSCGYCLEGCPMQIDIPYLLSLYNEYCYSPSFNVSQRVEALPEDRQPASCIACSACSATCPQKIDIPQKLADFAKRLSENPTWAEICRQRAEAAKKK